MYGHPADHLSFRSTIECSCIHVPRVSCRLIVTAAAVSCVRKVLQLVSMDCYARFHLWLGRPNRFEDVPMSVIDSVSGQAETFRCDEVCYYRPSQPIRNRPRKLEDFSAAGLVDGLQRALRLVVRGDRLRQTVQTQQTRSPLA